VLKTRQCRSRGVSLGLLTAALALRYGEAVSLQWYAALALQKDNKQVDHTQLAEGQVTESDLPVDRLAVVLITTHDGSEQAVIFWPPQPTRVSPRKLSETIARTCRILANSGIELAARHGRKRW
jgi:hypothetical protein